MPLSALQCDLHSPPVEGSGVMAAPLRICAAALAAVAAGCMALLPPGDPPSGGITDNRDREAISPGARRNRLATRIAASALPAEPRWDSLALECGPELLPLAEAAAREAATVAAFTVKRGTPPDSGTGCARLLGSRRGEVWEFALFSPTGELLWRELFSAGGARRND